MELIDKEVTLEVFKEILQRFERSDPKEEFKAMFICTEISEIGFDLKLETSIRDNIIKWFRSQKPTKILWAKHYNNNWYIRGGEKENPWWSFIGRDAKWLKGEKPRIEFLKDLVLSLEQQIENEVVVEPKICAAGLCCNEVDSDKDFCSDKCAKNWIKE